MDSRGGMHSPKSPRLLVPYPLSNLSRTPTIPPTVCRQCRRDETMMEAADAAGKDGRAKTSGTTNMKETVEVATRVVTITMKATNNAVDTIIEADSTETMDWNETMAMAVEAEEG